jgi:molecular chaperone GrpE
MPRHMKEHDVKVAGQETVASPDKIESQPDPAALQAENAALQAENEELKDRLLRTLADSENARRRIERSAEDSRKYAISSFARDLLTVADTLRLAVDATKTSAVDPAVGEGVEATERMLEAVLERAGVRKIAALGAKFDPSLHEAVAEMDDTDREPGSIAEVTEEGYTIHDRLLRPARVVVVKNRPSRGRHNG